MSDFFEKGDPLSPGVPRPVETTPSRAERRWPQLSQFFGAYLHQDFDLDGSAEECIERAICDRDEQSRRAVLAALQELRAEHTSEKDLAAVLLDLGMEYVPPGDGYTYRGWLDRVISRVEATARGG